MWPPASPRSSAGADEDVYTYQYNVSEVDREGDGVVPEQDTQAITVTVGDTHTGELDAAVTYPEGGMVFRNAYGAGEGGTRTLAFSGTKVLRVESGNNRPDIAGKYNFTLTGSEGAPMPKVTEATNGASGDISFGDITYTMENVFGAPAEAAPEPTEGEQPAAAEDEPMATSEVRTKEFTYKISETGSVAGVTNDPVDTRTITVTVTDNGDGTLSVDKRAESDATDFTFTNTYSVDPVDSTPTGRRLHHHQDARRPRPARGRVRVRARLPGRGHARGRHRGQRRLRFRRLPGDQLHGAWYVRVRPGGGPRRPRRRHLR